MKKLLSIIFFTIAGATAAMAQANPSLTLFMNPPTLALNTTGQVQITAGNFSSTGTIVANSVRIVFSGSVNMQILGLDPASDPRWTVFSLDPVSNTIQLRNTLGGFDASGFDLNFIYLNVRAISVGGPSLMTGVIQYIPGGNPLLGGANNSSQGDVPSTDNNGQSTLTVSAVVAVRFNDITAEPSDCSAKLKWSTAMEEAGSGFEVEYSPDGRNFVKVANIAGKQNPSGSSYEYAYNQGNGKGYYRLKITGIDGQFSYSKIVNANIKCNVKKVFIYPNPIKADEVLHVNVSNYEGNVKGELYGAEGKVVLTRTLQNGSNLITLTSLPQGTYNFKVSDDKGEMQSYKVVIIK